MTKPISTQQTEKNIEKLLSILAETPEKIAALSKSLTEEQFHQPLGEGQRSFIQDLAHLLNVEARGSEAIYSALMVKEPLLVRIHPEKDWGRMVQYEQLPIPEVLAYFKFRRAVLLRVLQGLKEKQWRRTIRQEGKQRRESVYWQMRGLALHEAQHLEELQYKLDQHIKP